MLEDTYAFMAKILCFSTSTKKNIDHHEGKKELRISVKQLC